MAKAAAQFYQGIVNRINEEQTAYFHTPKPGDKPNDITENIIDLGDIPKEEEYV